MLLKSKNYYIDLIDSSKAFNFTCCYHYSGTSVNKAWLNQGIYRKTDNLLVGVLQWWCAAQSGIRLDRYVKEPITTSEYLELNRFSMADSEGKNAESEGIGLGIKWIKKNRPDIRLLVSYAGRKEGNYGYIYQATNWEYLGYFISSGFWFLDGEERHQTTAWFRYKKYGDASLGFKNGLCAMYKDVRQTWSKQFIYIQRLDKNLTAATPLLPYPKPSNEYPVCTKVEIYKQDDEVFYSSKQNRETYQPIFFYERIGWIKKNRIAVYDSGGNLEYTADTITDAANYTSSCLAAVSKALKSGKKCKDNFFQYYEDAPQEQIEFDWICEIDGLRFARQSDVAAYCNVSRQAINNSMKRQSKTITGLEVIWNIKKE